MHNSSGGQEPGREARPLIQRIYFAGLFPGMNETVRRSRNDGMRLASRFEKRDLYGGPSFTQTKKDLTESIGMEVKNKLQLGELKQVQKCQLSFHWIEKKRNRDPDNISSAKKYIIDGLVVGGLLKNDGWHNIEPPMIDTWALGRHYGVWVTIKELP